MLDVAKCVIGFKKLLCRYIRQGMPTATADIPIAVYWTIQSIVACASQIEGLIGMGHEYIASTTDASELSSLAHKVSNMHSLLMKKLTVCLQLIEKQKQDELFQTIKSLFETPQIDNMKILKIFIYAKDNQPPLCIGSAERKHLGGGTVEGRDLGDVAVGRHHREDIEWIRKFSRTVQDVAREANVTNLQMIYIGKSHPREKVHSNNTTVVAEKLSHTLQDLALIRSFWVRLESTLLSKVQHGKAIGDDPIIREIMMMLSFDGSDQGWVVVSQGTAILAKAKGDILLSCFVKFDTWKDQVAPKGFIPAMKDHLHALHSPFHYRLILPGTSGGIPKKVVCTECGCPMEKFIMYRCCND